MARTAIDVVNLALAHLRQRSIASFADKSIEAVQAKRFYDEAVDETLRAFDWPFARSYLNCTPTSPNRSVPGWCYSFAYPADCLAIREIARCRQVGPIRRYRVATYAGVPLIFSNEPAITIIYTARPAAPNYFDAGFTLALSYHLAMLLAMPLTGKISLVDAMRKLADGAISKAEADAFNEDTNDVGEEPVPDWLAARGVPSLLRNERAFGWQEDGCCTGAWQGGGGTPDPGTDPLPTDFLVTVDPTTEGGTFIRSRDQSPSPAVVGVAVTVNGGREG